jgi:hypothetical protein
VLEGALASPEGLTCAIETFTNAPDFDSKKVTTALLKFYSDRGRVTVFEKRADGISATIDVDLFCHFSVRFLNHLIEQFAKHRTSRTDVLLGYCLAELRQRRLRMDFTTYEVVEAAFSNLRFQFRLADRGFVTPEMARPV